MNVLILSCNTGGGHNSVGGAVAEGLRARGHKAETVDFLGMTGKKVSSLICGTYIGMAKKAPAMFGVTYGLSRAVSSAQHKLGFPSPVYKICGRMTPALEEYLAERDFDAIVLAHIFAAEAVTYLKRKGVDLPLTVAVATDYTCTPFWEETDCDYLMIPGEVCREEFVRRGVPAEKLVPLGIPVGAAFYERIGKTESRKVLGLSTSGRWILIMGGSMGAGHITQLTYWLLKLIAKDVHIAVICGSNQQLYATLNRRYGDNPQVRVVGFTDQVARYMEASDLLYTKPGGITSTEGAVMQIPMVHLAPIPGCETRNRQMFTDSGMSVSGRGVLVQAVRGWNLLNDPARCQEMVASQRQQIADNAVRAFIDFLETHVESGHAATGKELEHGEQSGGASGDFSPGSAVISAI